jgi:hypothetical protein
VLGQSDAIETKNAKPKILQVYSLQYASADAISEALHELLDGQDVRVATDTRTNRIIVQANADVQDRVSALIQALDSRNDRPLVSIVKSEEKANTINNLLGQLGLALQVAIDPDLGVIVLRGNKEDVLQAQELINLLEPLSDKSKEWSEQQYTLEVFTITSGAAGDPAVLSNLDDDLDSVNTILQKKGIDHPILLAKTEIRTSAQSLFMVSDAAYAKISGMIEPASSGVRLEIDIRLTTDDRQVGFQTTIVTKLDHPIVFASTQPGAKDVKTYVLVVRVRDQ